MNTWKIFAKLLGKWYLPFVAVTADLISFFSGMTVFWSSPILAKLNGTDDNPFGEPITDEENDLLGSIFSIGGSVGPILLVYMMDLLGRKVTLLFLSIIFPIGYAMLVFSKEMYVWYVSRAILGVAVSGTYSIVPVYISEIVTSEMRGLYVSVSTCFILTGGFASYCMGPYMPLIYFNGFIGVASLIYTPFLYFACPESLYITMRKEGVDKTREVLKVLRAKNDYDDDVDDELDIIKETVQNDKIGNMFDVFKERAGVKAFLLSSMLLIFQQCIGITVVVTYTQEIFTDANVSVAPEVCSIIISAVQTVLCFVSPVLIRNYNLKTLMMISFAGISIANLVMGCYFQFDIFNGFNMLPLITLVFYVTSYVLGAGPLPWVFLGEIYSLKNRSWGTALSNTVYWLIQFVLTYTFNKVERGVAFIAFSVISLIAILFIKLFLIETKGKSLQEIQNELI